MNMEHNLEDWKEIVSFVNGIPIIDCSPLRWYNSDGKPLSPDELISFGYWGVRSAQIPSEYNPEINKLEEVELKDCEKDEEKKIIIRSYKVVDLDYPELSNLQRQKRNSLLEKTDKLVYPDIWEDLPQDRKDAIKSYRKSLRDVPQQSGFPTSIEWPIFNRVLPYLNTGIDPLNPEENFFKPPIITEESE